MTPAIAIALVVEDDLSLAVMERVIASIPRPYVITRPFVTRGFGQIKQSVVKYRQASHVLPHVVLTDLDRANCPASLRQDWQVSSLPANMLFRVAVRTCEAWVLADRHAFASFSGVALAKLRFDPDGLAEPKQALINLVRRSRNHRLVNEIVPAPSSASATGPLYNIRLTEFVRSHWNPLTAAVNSYSLRRTIARLQTFLIEPR